MTKVLLQGNMKVVRTLILACLFCVINISFANQLFHEEEDICRYLKCNCTKLDLGVDSIINLNCAFKRLHYLRLKSESSQINHHKHIKRHQNRRLEDGSIRFDARYNFISEITDEFHQIQANTARLIKELYLSYNR